MQRNQFTQRCFFGNKIIFAFIILIFPCFSIHAATATETIVIQPGPTEGKDTFYGTVYKTSGAPNLDVMEVGGWGDWYYSFIQIDLSSLPAASKILSAKLELYQHGTGITNNGKLERITESWNEAEITKNSNPSAVSIGMSWQTLPINDWWTVDITDLTKKWLEGTYENYGVKISGQYNSGGSYPQKHFYSSDYLADPTLRPRLIIEYTVENEENKYPLYTQVESPYPSLLETAEWADDTMPCGTIGECGCAISSLVSGANYFGLDTDVLGQSPTPATINTYLKSVEKGYTTGGGLGWLAAAAYFGGTNPEGKLASRMQFPPEFVESNVSAQMRSALDLGDKLVLAYDVVNAERDQGHFVWVPTYLESSFVLRDPLWYETKTSDDLAVPSLVRDYNNQFEKARIITVLDEPEVLSGTDIEVIIQGTAELLYKNALGQRVGYVDGDIVIDLERAEYGNITPIVSEESGEELPDGKTLLLHEAGSEFTIDVIGTDWGEYEMEFFTISETGEITTFSMSGQTIPGVTTTWSFNLETGEVVEQPISYEQFVSILEKTMTGYTSQQKAFFLKWAEKIYADMEEKTVSQALQSIEVYKKLLVAKKIESPVLSSVLNLLAEGVKKE